ncbi:MAG: hypothetical protein LAT62_03320 [Natronospirillum sp.]|uniref:hypothetical protein n=1 Tax=Natronospirillum sp. TaxID=2812955 RepID=UPI0025F5C20D|nr:hypothetical protein [Natronospirillum sp.]MCH8550940.1 hypothetical protein [Natronospirillum sp.]
MHAEALLVYQKETVAREMLYTEFMAVLDGVVSARSFAAQTMEAVYLQLDEQLNVDVMVFFRLPFDNEGRVADTWNLPLRDMAARARPGPVIKGRKTRLMCRSQCPEKWHSWLWEPRERNGRDPFADIWRVMRRNRLGLLPAHAAESEAEPPLITDGMEEAPDLQAELQRMKQREQQLSQHLRRLQTRLDSATNRVSELEASNQKLRDYIKVLKTEFIRRQSKTTHLE